MTQLWYLFRYKPMIYCNGATTSTSTYSTHCVTRFSLTSLFCVKVMFSVPKQESLVCSSSKTS